MTERRVPLTLATISFVPSLESDSARIPTVGISPSADSQRMFDRAPALVPSLTTATQLLVPFAT